MDRNIEQLTTCIQKRLFVELEASGRHIHVTREQAHVLFGHDLTSDRSLSQPGQFLAKERVQLKGPKGSIDHVAVLGPCRKEAQVELSMTDGRVLGLNPPVRLSGNVKNTPGIEVVGSKGSLELAYGVVVAMRHIHMTPEDAELQKVSHGDVVRLRTMTERPVVFEEVVVRVSPSYATFAHLDFDEANACGFQKGDLGMILH